MPTAKKSTHKQGQFCGYHELPNGDLKIAPTYVDQFQEIANERAGVDNVLTSVVEHCKGIQTRISARQKLLWDRICEDYGLDRDKFEIKYYGQGVLRMTPHPKDEKKDASKVQS